MNPQRLSLHHIVERFGRFRGGLSRARCIHRHDLSSDGWNTELKSSKPMSVPTTGKWIAKARDCTLHFDGETWTYSDPEFALQFGPFIADETTRHRGQHITLDIVATRVLDLHFPGNWALISCRVDRWKTKLPPGAID